MKFISITKDDRNLITLKKTKDLKQLDTVNEQILYIHKKNPHKGKISSIKFVGPEKFNEIFNLWYIYYTLPLNKNFTNSKWIFCCSGETIETFNGIVVVKSKNTSTEFSLNNVIDFTESESVDVYNKIHNNEQTSLSKQQSIFNQKKYNLYDNGDENAMSMNDDEYNKNAKNNNESKNESNNFDEINKVEDNEENDDKYDNDETNLKNDEDETLVDEDEEDDDEENEDILNYNYNLNSVYDEDEDSEKEDNNILNDKLKKSLKVQAKSMKSNNTKSETTNNNVTKLEIEQNHILSFEKYSYDADYVPNS